MPFYLNKLVLYKFTHHMDITKLVVKYLFMDKIELIINQVSFLHYLLLDFMIHINSLLH